MSCHLVVQTAGPLTTVQDLGRREGRRAGLAPGGAMDQRALLWANRLLENRPGAAALEIALGGTALRFDAPLVLALTGAECSAKLDGVPVGNWRTLSVGQGQTLNFGFTETGVRAYLAFPGGLDLPTAFGSASAVVRDGLGGLLGRGLESGDRLTCLDPDRRVPSRSVPADQIPEPPGAIELPLFTAYEWEAFSTADRDRVWHGSWTVAAESDRTACRLMGPTLASGPESLDSTPLVDGTVQVPGDGAPLIFMRDRPTIGGYPKLGSVGPIALDALAQARPGTTIRFIPGDPAASRAAMIRRNRFFGLD